MKLEQKKKNIAGKIKRKKTIKNKNKNLALIYDILPPEEIKRIAREVAGIKKYRSNKEKILAFSWRASLTAFLIVCFLTGFAPIKLIQHSIRALTQEQKIENFNLYSLSCSGGWQNPMKASGMPEVTAYGKLEMFFDENSAVYDGGTVNLICQNFDAREEEAEKMIKKEPIINSSPVNEEFISETSTQEIATATEEVLLTPTTTEEIKGPAEAETEAETALEQEELEEENNIDEQENLIFEENTSTQIESLENNEIENFENTTSTIIPIEETDFENNEAIEEKSTEEPVSFFDKIEGFFKNLKIFAQEEERQFQEIKINFSLAVTREGAMGIKSANYIEAQEEIIPSESIFDGAVDRVKTIIDENLTLDENQQEKIIMLEEKNIINVWYSLDGEAWWKLGSISESPASNASNGGYFEYSLPFVKNWADVKNLKIKFEGLGGEENNKIYLDSAWLKVLYQEEEEKEKIEEEEQEETVNASLSPNFEYGQIKQDVEEAGVRVIIIEIGGMSELWYYAPNPEPDSNGWTFFLGNGSLDASSPLGIKDKTFFWLDSCRQGIYAFSMPEQSLFGAPIDEEGNFCLEFKNKNQEKWQAVLSEKNEFKFIPKPLQ